LWKAHGNAEYSMYIDIAELRHAELFQTAISMYIEYSIALLEQPSSRCVASHSLG
jgi:hypothetical protein